MQDSRPARILQAINLGKQIHDLEHRLDPLLLEHSDRHQEINRINRELDQLWLEVGKLKHDSGE
jgi:hypothetical protein